jgi:hypothetical protein
MAQTKAKAPKQISKQSKNVLESKLQADKKVNMDKYDKMKKAGLPLQAIVNRMELDHVPDASIQKWQKDNQNYSAPKNEEQKEAPKGFKLPPSNANSSAAPSKNNAPPAKTAPKTEPKNAAPLSSASKNQPPPSKNQPTPAKNQPAPAKNSAPPSSGASAKTNASSSTSTAKPPASKNTPETAPDAAAETAQPKKKWSLFNKSRN